MEDDMDIDAGKIIAGKIVGGDIVEGVPMQDVADELLDLIVAVASGQPSKSEAQGIGEAEFCPWSLGGAL
jgi:altronate dehydratase